MNGTGGSLILGRDLLIFHGLDEIKVFKMQINVHNLTIKFSFFVYYRPLINKTI